MLQLTRFYIILITVLALFMSSCEGGSPGSEPEPEPPVGGGTSVILLKTSTPDMAGPAGVAPGDNLIDDVKAYVFTNNTFVSSVTLTGNQHSLEIDDRSDSRIYVVANTHVFPGLANLQAGVSTTLALDNLKSTDGASEGGASLFMMGYVDVKAGDKTASVDFARGVARIDVKTDIPAVEITAVRIGNTAVSSTLLPIGQSATTSGTMNLAKAFDEPLSLPQLGVFYLYEHSNLESCIVEVDVISDGVKTLVKAPMPSSISRNTIYEVVIQKVNGKISCHINSLDWSTGGIIEAQPDWVSEIGIDPIRSDTPDSVLVDVGNSEITVSGWGGKFSVAFSSDVQVDVIPQSNTSNIQFTKVEGEVNKYDVVVAPQGWNTGPYTAEYGLRNQLLQTARHKIKITVKDKPYVIPTATLGGIEWMAFNSLGADGLQQTRLSAGQTVEDVYTTRYAETMGRYFHWGLMVSFVPWDNTSANISGAKDEPWQTVGKMPCPPHFKVPSESDFSKVYPGGTSIPGSYSVNSIDYKISYVNPTTQIALPSNARIYPRYVVIEEVLSGEKLFLPLAGYKGDKSGGTGWSMGERLVLWTSQNGDWSGYARTFEISTSIVGSYPQLPKEAFAALRCIRK